MKTSALLLAAVATIAAAQSVDELVSQIPECILPCIREAATEAGCEEGDRQCECENADAISTNVALCVVADSPCDDEASLATAAEVSVEICALVLAGGEDSEDSEDSETSTPTDNEEEAEETGTETETGDEPEETGADEEEDADTTDEEDDSADPTETDDSAEPEETPGAAGKATFAWAGVAAAVAAMAL